MNNYIPKKKYFDKKGNQISEEMYEILKNDGLLDDKEKPKYLKPVQKVKEKEPPTFFSKLRAKLDKVLEFKPSSEEEKSKPKKDPSQAEKEKQNLQRINDEQTAKNEEQRQNLQRLEDEKRDRAEKDKEVLERLEDEKKDKFGSKYFFKPRPWKK